MAKPTGNENSRDNALRSIVAGLAAIAAWWLFLAHARWLVGAEPPMVAPPTAIELRMIELPPVPPVPPVSEAVQASTQHEDAPGTPHRNPASSHVSPLAHRGAVPNPHRAIRPLPFEARATHATLPEQHDAPAPATPVAKDAPPASVATAASSEARPAADSSASINQQARLLAQPLPELPDDLREEGYQATAVARFAVHADGSFDVELVKPTQIPRLNQILLATLRQWRFFPAMEDGHPVESHQDVRVHFNVN